MNQPTAGRLKPLPRHQRGVAPQNIIAVLFGDYWFARQEPIPSAALVELLDIFGISDNSARAAIQRLARRRFLFSHRQGRRTAYSVHTSGKQNLVAHVQRLFQAHFPATWDGTWTILTYGAPGLQTPSGRLIRQELLDKSFGRLNDSLWIKPGQHGDLISDVLQRLPRELAEVVTYFENATLPTGITANTLRDAFNSDDFDVKCQHFTEYWVEQAEQMSGNWPVRENALLLRTRIMSEWRALLRDNPNLPAEMMSDPSPIQLAAETCAKFYDVLGEAAEDTVRTIIKRHDAELASYVRHHTFAEADALIEEVLAE